MAVAGNMDVPVFVVTSEQEISCANPTSNNTFATYSLVVGGHIDAYLVSVNGDGYIAGGGDINRVTETVADCTLHINDGTGMLNFTLVELALVRASQKLANMIPTDKLESNGSITSLGDHISANTSPRYRVFTMNTCQNSLPPSYNCSDIPSNSLSDPSAMFFGKGAWNGPIKSHPEDTDNDATTVINVRIYDNIDRSQLYN